MLKNIRYHLAEDAEQVRLEEEFAKFISEKQKVNINSFLRNIPSLVSTIQNRKTQNIAPFVNKWGEANIVDFSTGRALYGLKPKLEISSQVDAFFNMCLKVDINDTAEKTRSSDCVDVPDSLKDIVTHFDKVKSDEIELLIVMGLGVGHHIEFLLDKIRVRNLVIYEPEEQYFLCSSMIANWDTIFKKVRQQGCSVFFQIGKDSRDIIDNVKELKDNINFDSFFIYKHYNHPVFDSVYKDLSRRAWGQIERGGISFSTTEISADFCEVWSNNIELASFNDVESSRSTYDKNIRAFEKYFPNIADEFANYEPKYWLPLEDKNGCVNLLNYNKLTFLYGDNPKTECELELNEFKKNPNIDGLVIDYHGNKLKDYLHYRFVKKTQKVISKLKEEKADLPEDIKSLIFFGIGSGYGLESILQSHNIKNVFICEPNRDFFYASLFSIEWYSILENIDKSEHRIYINIGDDGTSLFRDLLNQFYSIGPYILAETYFISGYYNALLNETMAQLREQLQVVIAMGEYFDHARYGISQTRIGIKRQFRHLIRNPSACLSIENKEVPVILVGNGPSLDSKILTLKSLVDKAIIVSCGTSLQVLHKNGITPDFHAEIEQNRATFDWCSRIGSHDYLQKIDLITCNGVHPDTAALFKEKLIAFKEGESSTTSILSVAGEERFSVLKFAFPTVTNFSLNLFKTLGFVDIYLIGVDLGFEHPDNHHSKQSGYYSDDGKPLYDFKASTNTSIAIKGNFVPYVFTKHEFRVAKHIIEQTLESYSGSCYNAGEGAYIAGAIPLRIDDFLITSSPELKKKTVERILDDCYQLIDFTRFDEEFNAKYSAATLDKEISAMITLTESEISNLSEVEEYIERVKSMMFASYQNGASLLFYYLYGTINFVNVAFTKLLRTALSDKEKLEHINQQRLRWLTTFKDIKEAVLNFNLDTDFCSSLSSHRIEKKLHALLKKKHVIVLSEEAKMIANFKRLSNYYDFKLEVTAINSLQVGTECDLLIVDINDSANVTNEILNVKSKVDFVKGIVCGESEYSLARCLKMIDLDPRLSVMQGFQGKDWLFELNPDIEILNGDKMRAYCMLMYVLSADKYKLFYPKVEVFEGATSKRNTIENESLSNQFNTTWLEFSSYYALPRDDATLLDSLENRARQNTRAPQPDELILNYIPEELVVASIERNFSDCEKRVESWKAEADRKIE